MTDNFFECIQHTLQQLPEQELIVWPGEKESNQACTGSAILNRIASLRKCLSVLKLKSGAKILVALPVESDLVCTILAVMANGAIPVLPPAGATPRTLLSLIRKGKISALVIRQKPSLLFVLLSKIFAVQLISTESVGISVSEWLPPKAVNPRQAALISHSSGSTGKPKAIHRSHQVLLAQHLALKAAFQPWPGQRDFPLFPNILLHNLATGSTSILPDLPGFLVRQMDCGKIIEQIICQRIQTLTGNVFYYTKLLHYLQDHPLTLMEVQALGIGGSPVPECLLHALKVFFTKAHIYCIYGSSEAEPIAIRQTSFNRLNPCLGYAVGNFVPSLQWQIHPMGTVDFQGNKSYPMGEIEVKGAHVATSDSNGWLKTGDFGYLDENNQLFLTGRKGNERLHQGVQHYQVEHVLQHVPGVERVAARSEEAGFSLFIEGKVSESAIWKVLTEHFPEGIFRKISFRENLPVDSRHQSKILYEQLK